MNQNNINNFHPLTVQEMKYRNWTYVDIILITGDAYVDHPSFGTAVIARVLESKGYRVAIISMPDWRNAASVTLFGRPALFFGVTSGAVDSMIANYTAFKRKRKDDPYVPGGKAGHRPDRAVIVYCNLIKKIYKDVPIVIGGIEASMRRIAHYDFWDDNIRRSIIEDSRADILVYGMGETQLIEIAARLSAGKRLNEIPGTVVILKETPGNAVLLPSETNVISEKKYFIDLYTLFYKNQHKILAQQAGKRWLVHYPAPNMNSAELDSIYALPYIREPHYSYKEKVPAFEMIKNSITCHRGCFSGCSFCSLSLHQGKRIVSRSEDSILSEAEKLAKMKYFKGHITDIGGPSANMYGFSCRKSWKCTRESCTFPSLCKNLVFSTERWIKLLEKAVHIKKINKVTIGSGIRYDLFMNESRYKIFLTKLVNNYISGQLKIAPEHISETVLRAMRKTPLSDLLKFINLFREINKRIGKKQFLIPYLMSCHPGSTDKDIININKELFNIFGFIPEQTQAFIPLPMTLSSVIYKTGIDPLTREKFNVTRNMNIRKNQHKAFYKNIINY